jgi:hypothetical protein
MFSSSARFDDNSHKGHSCIHSISLSFDESVITTSRFLILSLHRRSAGDDGCTARPASLEDLRSDSKPHEIILAFDTAILYHYAIFSSTNNLHPMSRFTIILCRVGEGK